MSRFFLFLVVGLCSIIWCSETNAQTNKTYKVGNVEFTMVFVKCGTFEMGHTVEQGSQCDMYNSPVYDRPAHKVIITRNYYIGQTEVTQALWQTVMGDNPSFDKGDDKPVSNVSWDDCMKFIERLNSMTGEKFRLPTEAEWEFAARGGNKSKMCRYPGSNKLDEVAWHDMVRRYPGNDKFDDVASNNMYKPFVLKPVASKKPNELGLYDMLGNVWEWCSDFFMIYPPEYRVRTLTDPQGPTREMRPYMYVDEHVIRGMSSVGASEAYHISERRGSNHCDIDFEKGFRLAR